MGEVDISSSHSLQFAPVCLGYASNSKSPSSLDCDRVFEHLENFLSAFIDVDHRGKTVTFHFIANDSDFNTSITLNHVVDDFTVEVSSEGESSYRGVSTLRYSDCDHEMWKFYSCNWLVENHEKMIVRYETLNDLIEANENLKETIVGVEYPDSNLEKSYMSSLWIPISYLDR